MRIAPHQNHAHRPFPWPFVAWCLLLLLIISSVINVILLWYIAVSP